MGSSIIDRFFGTTMPGIAKALELNYKRNQALISNVTNAETPGYRAVDVNFGNELKKAFGETENRLLKTDAKHLDIGESDTSRFVPDYSGATKADGNNVDIDLQMGRLAYTAGKYSIAANLMRKKLQFIKQAIRTGGR